MSGGYFWHAACERNARCIESYDRAERRGNFWRTPKASAKASRALCSRFSTPLYGTATPVNDLSTSELGPLRAGWGPISILRVRLFRYGPDECVRELHSVSQIVDPVLSLEQLNSMLLSNERPRPFAPHTLEYHGVVFL